MKVPSREALLSELDSLGYGARIARASRLGRDGRGSPELTQLMDALLSGDAYQASLARRRHSAGRVETKRRMGSFGTISSLPPYISNIGASRSGAETSAASIRSTSP